jgi:uncharacterized membrane protein
MTDGFARGAFHASTLAAIEQVNALLAAEHFPPRRARQRAARPADDA